MSIDFFNEAIEVILANEGGYVNDPNDKGGETKFGISKASYPHLDIKNLTKEEAIKIYKSDFWDDAPYRNITSEPIAIKMFDLAVNIGAHYAMVVLQRALRTLHKKVTDEKLDNDLIIDLVNAASTPEEALLCAIKSEAAAYYRLIDRSTPKYLTASGKGSTSFLKGWLNRAYR